MVRVNPATYPQADDDVDTQHCGLDDCPVDCVGTWAEWCSCSSSCRIKVASSFRSLQLSLDGLIARVSITK